MPTYGYRCTVCGHEFERFQKITDPAVKECESCGEAVKKMLYPVGIQFVGSGFHVNDYNKSAASSSSNGSAAAKNGSGSDSGSGSESKPSETKTESATTTAASSSEKAAAPAASTSDAKTPAGTASSAS